MIKLIVPLPPSVNKAYYHNSKGKFLQTFYSKFSKDWFEQAIPIIQNWMTINKMKSFEDYMYCDMHFYLNRRNSDSHNFTKILFDGFEKAGLFIDDRYIMARTQEIDLDPKYPRIECIFSIPTKDNIMQI